MAKLSEILDPSKLKTASELRGIYRKHFTDEQLEENARRLGIPHYRITDPLTGEECIYFIPNDVKDWFVDNCIRYYQPIDQKLYFTKIDPEHYKCHKKDVIPFSLSKLKDLCKLPISSIVTPPGIYFLCLEGEIMYIGQAVNVASRVLTHIADKLKYFDEVYFLQVQPERLSEIESTLIKFYRPRLNITGVPKEGESFTDSHIISELFGEPVAPIDNSEPLSGVDCSSPVRSA
jgi:hypothetical protein